MATDPVAVGERITQAMNRGGWEYKALHEALHKRTGKAKGTSYGAVWAYANGQGPAEPRENVMEALAELLGVNVRWLLYGVGPKNPSEEAERAAEEGPPPGAAYLDDLEEGVAKGFGDGADRILAPGMLRSTIVRTYGRTKDSAHAAARFYADEGRPEAKWLGRALRAPLDELGIKVENLSDPELLEYVTAACAAIRHLNARPWPKRKSIRSTQEDTDGEG